MAEDISNAEIVRRLDDIKHMLSQVVRQDVYQANREADLTRLGKVEAEIERSDDDRRALGRWVVTAIVVPVLMFVGNLLWTTKGGGA